MYSQYLEMSIDFHKSFGPYPDGLAKDITTRFPMLLLHTYRTMDTCAGEPTFGDYYRSYQTALPTVNRTSLVTAVRTAVAVVASENMTPLVSSFSIRKQIAQIQWLLIGRTNVAVSLFSGRYRGLFDRKIMISVELKG